MIYKVLLAAVWWQEKKCFTLGLVPPGRQMKQNRERGDIANKGGYCVQCRWQPGGTGAFICLWHQQLKPITCALSFSDLSLHTSFFSLPSIGLWCCSSPPPPSQVPTDSSGYLSLSPFSFSLVLSRFSSPSFISVQSKSQTRARHRILCQNSHPFTHVTKYAHISPTLPQPHRCICAVGAFCNNSSCIYLET